MKKIFDGKVVRLFTKVRNGLTLELVDHDPAIAVIPVDNEGKLILLKQHREGVKKSLWEIPAGLINKDEDHILSAQRELQEEIGYRAETLIHLGGYYSSPGFCNEKLEFFLGLDLIKSSLPKDLDEEIEEVRAFELVELCEMIDKGEIEDLKTLTGIFYFMMWNQKEYSHEKKSKKSCCDHCH